MTRSASSYLFLLHKDIFKVDPNYPENEEKYKAIKAEILGEDSDEESGSSEDSDESDDEGNQYLLWFQS